MNSREREFLTRKNLAENGKKLKGPSTSRAWPSFKDPRIVRVARSFGGKDRHSKVFTVRGLRDRRVRLSVQTAIQLYDLQDKLGLSQPSKVVDWLLDAAQDDIDKLPPLQMPIETLLQYAQVPLAIPHEVAQNQYHSNSTVNYMKLASEAMDPQIMNAHNEIREGGMKLHMWASCKQAEKETNQEGMVTHNSIARANQSLFANNIAPYASYYHWEPSPSSSCTVPQYFGGSGCSMIPSEDQSAMNPAALPHSLPVTSGSHLLLYPSGSSVSSMFPSFVPADCDPKNYLINLQMPSHAPIVPGSLSTTTFYPPSSSMRSFQIKNDVVSSKNLPSENEDS